MKWLFQIVFLILLCQFVSASYLLVNHEPVTINGKVFELSGMGENDVYVKIDGKTSKVSQDELRLVNGVWMQALFINMPYDNNPLTVEMTISMDYTCGNKICEKDKGETSDICCTDCNCTVNNTCVTNRCILSSLNKCLIDIQCDDKDACTSDTCTGFPLKCAHSKVTECVTGDGCCPEECNKTVDYVTNDWECLPTPTCMRDANCTDDDESTVDICDSRTKTCRFETMVAQGKPITGTKKETAQTQNQGNMTGTGTGIMATINDYYPAVIGVIGILGAIYLLSITIFKKYKTPNNRNGQ
jgi:hypothetical protein